MARALEKYCLAPQREKERERGREGEGERKGNGRSVIYYRNARTVRSLVEYATVYFLPRVTSDRHIREIILHVVMLYRTRLLR